jgi:hypothetical protein
MRKHCKIRYLDHISSTNQAGIFAFSDKKHLVDLDFTHLITGTSFAVVVYCAANLPPRTSALCPQARPGYRYRRSPQRAVSLVARPFSRLLPNFRRYRDSFRTSAEMREIGFHPDLRGEVSEPMSSVGRSFPYIGRYDIGCDLHPLILTRLTAIGCDQEQIKIVRHRIVGPFHRHMV